MPRIRGTRRNLMAGKQEAAAGEKESGNDPWKILMFPQLAEKSMNMVETENKLVFIVSKKATKKQIREAVEKQFKVRTIGASVQITRKGQKKAIVKLHPDDSAADIASRLGML
jgi:large subunit ribosomal protein L23